MGIKNFNDLNKYGTLIGLTLKDLIKKTKTESIKEILEESVKYTFPKGCNKLLEYISQIYFTK